MDVAAFQRQGGMVLPLKTRTNSELAPARMSGMPGTVEIRRLELECPRPTPLANMQLSKRRHRSVSSVGRTAKEMLFERMRNGETQSGMHSYATSLPSGVKVKSSAISLYRFDRNELVKRLDERGQFGVKRAAPINAARFCSCQATICNKLREAHDLQGCPS